MPDSFSFNALGDGPKASLPLVDRVLVFVPKHGSQPYAAVITNAAAALGVDARAVRAALTELAAGRRIIVESSGGYDFVRRGDGPAAVDYPLRPRPLHRTRPIVPRRVPRTRVQ